MAEWRPDDPKLPEERWPSWWATLLCLLFVVVVLVLFSGSS